MSAHYKYLKYKLRKHEYFIYKTQNLLDSKLHDKFWERLKLQYDFSIVRDYEYFLNRFIFNPIARYEIYYAKQNNELCGIMVSRIKTIEKRKRICFIADWLIDNSKEKLFDMMLAHIININRGKEIHAFIAWANEKSPHFNALKKLWFLDVSRIPVIFYESKEGIEIINNCQSIDFTLASSDNI